MIVGDGALIVASCDLVVGEELAAAEKELKCASEARIAAERSAQQYDRDALKYARYLERLLLADNLVFRERVDEQRASEQAEKAAKQNKAAVSNQDTGENAEEAARSGVLPHLIFQIFVCI